MDMDLPQEFNSAGPVEPPRPGKNPDAIKLFVGQVPKTFEEKDLLPYLERYGAIHELSVLRDKLSHAHKGLPGVCKLVCTVVAGLLGHSLTPVTLQDT